MTNPGYLQYPRLDEELHRKLCQVLLEIRRRFPDLRLGQLVSNLSCDADSKTPVIEDQELLSVAESFLDRHRDREPDIALMAPLAPSPDAA